MSELDPDTRSRLQDLTTEHGVNIPNDVLETLGISRDDYAAWRMELADEERHLRELRAREDSIEAANKPGALPPRRTPEEVAEIERREQELERLKQRRGEAEWEDDSNP